jgi:hypothetical protein
MIQPSNACRRDHRAEDADHAQAVAVASQIARARRPSFLTSALAARRKSVASRAQEPTRLATLKRSRVLGARVMGIVLAAGLRTPKLPPVLPALSAESAISQVAGRASPGQSTRVFVGMPVASVLPWPSRRSSTRRRDPGGSVLYQIVCEHTRVHDTLRASPFHL